VNQVLRAENRLEAEELDGFEQGCDNQGAEMPGG
jgi:hypothetical protein